MLEKKKVLFIATVLRKHIDQFHLPYIKWFIDQDYDVTVIAKNDYDNLSDYEIPNSHLYTFINLDFSRNPVDKNNMNAFKFLKNFDLSEYALVHCHTPVASVLARLAFRKSNVPVIYTAHGFQFSNQSGLKDKIFYPIEKFASNYTDALITINNEDYELASSKFKKCEVFKVRGVGIDLKEFSYCPSKQDNHQGKLVLSYVAEFIDRKNHKLLLDVSSELKEMNIEHVVLLPGDGVLQEELKRYADAKQLPVEFMGYRKDIPDILNSSDFVVSTSKREGLAVNIMESFACGVPVLTVDARGATDIVAELSDQLICDSDANQIARRLVEIYNNRDLYEKLSNDCILLSKKYEISTVLDEYKIIYEKYLRRD